RDVCAPRQPPRALLWHLDLAAHSAGGAAGDESAPRNGRWPGGRALRRALAQRSAQGSPEPREQWRAGKRGTDGEQIVGERARGAGGRGPQPLAVEEQSGSEEAGGRGERDEGEEHVRSARFEEQLGRAGAGSTRRKKRVDSRHSSSYDCALFSTGPREASSSPEGNWRVRHDVYGSGGRSAAPRGEAPALRGDRGSRRTRQPPQPRRAG